MAVQVLFVTGVGSSQGCLSEIVFPFLSCNFGLNCSVKRKPTVRSRRNHHCLLINEQATNFNTRMVSKLISAIKRRGDSFTVLEPKSAVDLLTFAQVASGIRRRHRLLSQQIHRRGKVTSLIACGGDGTFNLVARAGLEAELPVSVLPMGLHNNIARSLYGAEITPEAAIKRLLRTKVSTIDSAVVGDQFFFGSLGMGYTVELFNILRAKGSPRFGIGWKQLSGQAASAVERGKIIIKLDSFRFETDLSVLNINLLPYSSGLPLSPASVFQDVRAEVILGINPTAADLSAFVRESRNGKYVFGSAIRLFRGRQMSLQPVKGRTILLDGELIRLPMDLLEIEVGPKQLKVYS